MKILFLKMFVKLYEDSYQLSALSAQLSAGLLRSRPRGGFILDSPPRRTAAVMVAARDDNRGGREVYSGFPSLRLENDKRRGGDWEIDSGSRLSRRDDNRGLWRDGERDCHSHFMASQ
jgi:hypothetical protein